VPARSTPSKTAGTGQLIGYARVSTVDQNPQLQLDALDHAGCDRLFTDHASGSKTDRPQLAAALEHLRAGDTLCIWKLDRLGRSLPHLIEIAGQLADRDIALRSLTEQIDTASAGGRLIFHMFGALAEFERDLIRERTHAGLAAARARGRKGGRRSVMTPQKIRAAKALLAATDEDGLPSHTYDDVAQTVGVSRSTIIRHCT
jgi:DNA invertase Pin-like site-specific DNA recombinase